MKKFYVKRYLCALMCVVCVFALCCSCTENEGDKNDPNRTPNPQATQVVDNKKGNDELVHKTKQKYATVVATDSENGTVTLHMYAIRKMKAGETDPDGVVYSSPGMYVNDLETETVFTLSDTFTVEMGEILSYDGIGDFSEYDTTTELSYFMDNATQTYGNVPLYFRCWLDMDNEVITKAQLCYEFYFESYNG